MSFEDNILLKLKREYSKDEKIAFVLKKCSDLQIENGILKSEISELKDTLAKKIKPSGEVLQQLKEKGWHKEFLHDEYIIELKRTIATLEEKCKTDNVIKLQRNYDVLKYEYAGLKCQIEIKDKKIKELQSEVYDKMD